MQPVHADPYEAVQIHRDVRSQQSVGMHWGTFRLTDEPLGEPPLLLRRALDEAGLVHAEFRVLNVGETLALPAGDVPAAQAARLQADASEADAG
jgi:N-acyl-phosphatidylethanolamine-hydrolysing phospholipase D